MLDPRVSRSIRLLDDKGAIELPDYEAGSISVVKTGIGSWEVREWEQDFAQLVCAYRHQTRKQVEDHISRWFRLVDQLDSL